MATFDPDPWVAAYQRNQNETIDALHNTLNQITHENAKLRQSLYEMRLDELKEITLREKYPAVLEAWKQYQLMLKLLQDKDG